MSEYLPRIKSRSFFPNPVAKHGIPAYANTDPKSGGNVKLFGTAAHTEWWEEQIRYCLNGYDTGGMHIPGRFYKYLNFDTISTVGRGNHYPDYVDLDFDYFELVEDVKKDGKGIICVKARRKGLSEKMVSIIDTGFRFTQSAYQAGIAAGLEEHAQDFFAKFKRTMALKPPELMLHLLEENSENIVAGWKEKEETGHIVKGSKNVVFCKTMYHNANVFKGKYLNDAIFEEGGEFDRLIDGFNATKACFMIGNKMVGTPYVYGTGGNMKKGSKGFQEMWAEAESFKLAKFFVPATRMYFPCVGGHRDENGKPAEETPNLQMYTPTERYGMEDVACAEEMIKNERRSLASKRNKKPYYDFLQDYPLTEKESFLKFSGNNFPTEILQDRNFELLTADKEYILYELEWIMTPEGAIKQPLQVKAVPVEIRVDGDIMKPDNNYVMIHNAGHPRPDFKYLDVAGIDSYDLDESKTSKSLGAMVVFRGDHSIKDIPKMAPVCLYNCRPRRKETFYETCLKISVYYNLVGDVLLDLEKQLIAEFFNKNGGARYWAPRPLSIESPDSKQSHNIGVKMTGYSKPKMIAMLQSYFYDHTKDIVFPQLVEEALDYDVEQKDSDWDIIDALGFALIRYHDRTIKPQSNNDENDVNDNMMPEWREDSSGNLIYVDPREKGFEDIRDPFLRMIKQGLIR